MTSHLQSVDFVCGNCQTQISPGSRFCLGCGQPLYEACSCGAEVLLNQAFCNHCGCDLQQKLNHRRDEIEKRLCLAEASRGEGDWSGAVKLLQGARVPQDFRFHDLRQRIDEAIDAIEREAKTWEGRIHKALETAESLAGEQRHRQLIELVEAIPPRARPSRLQDWLAAAQRHVAAEESARSRLQESLDRSDYADALAAAVALLELKPQSSSRRRQVEKLMAIVRQRAKQYARAGRHDKCLELLRCMPAEMQHHEDQELLRDCDETVLAGAVVRHAAQVTPLVVKLLDRCFTDAPSNPLRTKLSQAIARAQRRHRETKAPFVYPLRRAVRLAETNVPIYPLNIPAGVAIDGNVAARLGPQFFLALGAARQMVDATLPAGGLGHHRRRAILGGSRPKPHRAGWGIEVGERLVSAVLLSRTSGDRLVIEDAQSVSIPFRSGGSGNDSPALLQAISRLRELAPIGNAPVWVNYPSAGLFVRSVILPPDTTPKRQGEFILQEAKANIPTPLDQLDLAWWVSDVPAAGGGFHAIILGARREYVESRIELLRRAGLKVAGMIPDPFCLWMACRQIMPLVDTAAKGVAPEGDHLPRGDLWLHVGGQQTTLLLSTRCAMWTRTLDWGTDALARAVSKELRTTIDTAYRAVIDPLHHERMGPALRAMQAACVVPRREIALTLRAAESAVGTVALSRVFLTGPGARLPLLLDWLAGHEF